MVMTQSFLTWDSTWKNNMHVRFADSEHDVLKGHTGSEIIVTSLSYIKQLIKREWNNCFIKNAPKSRKVHWNKNHTYAYHICRARSNKHLMTDPEENNDLCFPEIYLNVPRGETEGNIDSRGKQNSLSPEGLIFKCFVIPPDSKLENNCEKWFAEHYCSCACSTSGSQTELSYRNDSITVFFFAANKK